MSSDLLSLLQDQFGCCVKLLKLISHDDQNEAIRHIRTGLSELESEREETLRESVEEKMVKVSTNAEYIERNIKEEEDVKPDLAKLYHSNNNASGLETVKLESTSKKRKSSHFDEESSISNKNYHNAAEVNDEEESFSLSSLNCPLCVGRFLTENTLNHHIKNHHPNNANTNKGFKIPKKKKFRCNLCNRSFKTRYKFEEHMEMDHKYQENSFIPINAQDIMQRNPDWCSPGVEVLVQDRTGLCGEKGVVKGVVPQSGMCSVFMYAIKRNVKIDVDHLSPVVPKLGDKLKILGNEDNDQTGELLSIDIEEGVVKLDHSGDVKVFQMRFLCKMKSED